MNSFPLNAEPPSLFRCRIPALGDFLWLPETISRWGAAALILFVAGAAAAEFPAPFNTEKTPGGPMPAEEAARTMELPPGFRCQVFAAEPDVQQPIAMAWDARGRLWIA